MLKKDNSRKGMRIIIVGCGKVGATLVEQLEKEEREQEELRERNFEKQFMNVVEQFNVYDFIFFDLPPSSNRTTELLLDYCEKTVLIVELNKLGINGFYNTLQYFVDSGISLDKIEYILPNGFSKHKAVPQVAYSELVELVKVNVPKAKILPNVPEKTCVKVGQQNGISIFDKKAIQAPGNLGISYFREER